jgi:hypothetical protein
VGKLTAGGFVLDRRVLVLWAGLVRQQNQFLCAAAVGVEVNNKLEAGVIRVTQAKVGCLDGFCLFGRNDNMRPFQQAQRFGDKLITFGFRNHNGTCFSHDQDTRIHYASGLY